MSIVKDAAEQLETVLKTVKGVRFYRDVGASVDPPALLLGPPRLQWEAYCTDPTSATFVVHLMVAMDDRALERLWDLVPLVAAAVETVPNAVTTTADPSTFKDLPAYELTVEVSL